MALCAERSDGMEVIMKNQYDIENNIAQVLNLIGDRWSLLILFKIYKGNNTYNSIQKSLGKIPTNLLAERLKSLEVDDLIKAEKYEDHPPRYRYSLTESGSDLKDVFRSLSIWGQKHLYESYSNYVHSDCGHEIEICYYCPECNEVISEEDITEEE